MKKFKNKKTIYTIIGIVFVLLVTIGLTYAYWLITKKQTNRNLVTTKCLDISISGEKNDLELTNQFPMSDEEGMKLVPYEFTVTNNCNTSVDYQVALEAIGDSTNALKETSLKVALNDSAKLYSAYPNVETTIDGAYESRVLGYSKVAASGNEGSSIKYRLRIWIDADAPISEMNKTFKSKISVTVGQGIFNPYEEGTLAYDILSNYGGEEAISEIDATEYDHRIRATGNQYISTSSNYYYGTEYTYDETIGEYTLSGTLTQATTAECRNGTKTCGKYTLKSTSSTSSNTAIYEVTDFQSSGNYVTANTIQYKNVFGKLTTSSDTGVYKTQDDLGDSYYYRGVPTNNYVEFGTYGSDYTRVRGYSSSTSTGYKEYATLEECNAATTYNYNCAEYKYASAGDPMYWRIVRINGDGTVRIIYDGVEKVANGIAHTAIIGETAFNANLDKAKYVGYTYEVTNEAGKTVQVDSTIKGALDTWYDTHLEANYGDKIADSIFCNDRSEASYTFYDENYSTITDPNAAVYTDIYYGAYDRLNTYNTPSLKCTNKEDRYTVDDTTNGNGLLTNPVGLITADEAMMAGDSASSNYTYYLYNGGDYWTSAPYRWLDKGFAFVWYVYEGGGLDGVNALVNGKSGVRPVINLKADVKFTGDGTIDSPYEIVTQ